MAGGGDEGEPPAQRRLDRGPRRERRGFVRRGTADGVVVEPDRIPYRANEVDVLGGVAPEQLLDRRGAALAPQVLVREENPEAFGSLKVLAGWVQPRERGMRQDVD